MSRRLGKFQGRSGHFASVRSVLYTVLASRRDSKVVMCTLVQALRLGTGRTAHKGSRGIALLILDHGTRRGQGSASRHGRSLPPGKNRYPLYRRLCGPQGRSGQVGKISPPTGIRSQDRPARSQSLYRLSYPAHMRDCAVPLKYCKL